MPLELMKGRNGSIRPTWYGRYESGGRRYKINLGIRVAGQPPASLSLRELGDTAFEKSRTLAQAKLNSIIAEVSNKSHSEHLVERLYEIKTGATLQTTQLDILPEEWLRIPRRRKPAANYAGQCQAILKRFVTFARARPTPVAELSHVTPKVAQEFLASEAARGVTAKTWNDTLKLLRATCKYLLPPGCTNPFLLIPTRETETIYRRPFNPEELKAIVDAAREDDFIRPILVTGICTAMRRGDCCLLKWSDVDLEHRFITVKTAKTGVTVSIPIFPMLYDELTVRKPSGAYVFPEQAKMYKENPDGITWRVHKVLAMAGFVDSAEAPGMRMPLNGPLPVEIRDRVLAVLDRQTTAVGNDPRRIERMRQVFTRYAAGGHIKQVMAAERLSKGSVSNYLNELEKLSGETFIRGKLRTAVQPRGEMHVARKGGLRRASVLDFHSFRVTWVTLALTAGVPIELVRKVTGHKTAEIVVTHYFQPGREEFRHALQTAMPKLLTNGNKTPRETMREVIEGMTSKTTEEDKARLLELLATV